MKIAILGYGLEGHSAENYFKSHGHTVQIFEKITPGEISPEVDTADVIIRSPSVRPEKNWSSITKYFFDHCPAKIIGVTGTKGKGTTSSMIATLLAALGKKVWLVGNIGTPSIEVLDQIQPEDVVVYEMSSFQLWDLQKSPTVAVVLRIEPDHLDVHRDFDDYVDAKTNITRYQTSADFCVYYRDNVEAVKIAESSAGHKIPYPALPTDQYYRLVHQIINQNLQLRGAHNQENAEAAIVAVAGFYHLAPADFIAKYQKELATGLANFQGLPHRLQFIRELNNVEYYDDNYSSAYPALDVALAAFEHQPTVLIAGGKDRHLDLSEIKNRLKTAPNLVKVVLIGETKEELAEGLSKDKYVFADTLPEAVSIARQIAETSIKPGTKSVIVMSPGAASFDMFKNFQDRGEKFQTLVKELK